jgi:type IV secretory pathway VirB2 component (pilin)
MLFINKAYAYGQAGALKNRTVTDSRGDGVSMKLTITKDQLTRLALCLVVAYAAMLMPAEALAQFGPVQEGGTIGSLLCRVANWFTGPVGSGIATLAILVIGVGALMGKVSWGMAIIVGIGVAVIFGADQIVRELGGSDCADVLAF